MACSKVAPKRKVDSENRQFHPEWTERFAFFLPPSSTRPLCLICQESVAAVKMCNVKRHYESKHKHFEETFPQNSTIRTTKLNSLMSSYQTSSRIIHNSLTKQQKATECSFRVAWRLAKHGKPFKDAEMVKECMVDVMDTLLEGKEKEEMKALINQIPLSDSSACRRTEMLASDVAGQLSDGIKKTECISIAVDESTDATDVTQLIVFVRYFDESKGEFIEDVLGMADLCGQTRGEDIYNAVMGVLNEKEIDVKKIVSVATDGAPSMMGREKGLVQRLKLLHPQLISYHCIIHQSILCASLGEIYAEIMNTMMKLANFLRASSALQHRLLKLFLTEVNAEFDDLLLHNNIRWLSKGKVLERFWAIRNELQLFLSQQKSAKAKLFMDFLQNPEMMEAVAFLTDMTSHMNDLNLKLQGKGNTVCELMSAVRAFQRKLQVFKSDLQEELLHFPRLLEQTKEKGAHQKHMPFLEKLIANFQKRFDDFILGEKMLLCISNPFLVNDVRGFSSEAHQIFPYIPAAALQIELIDLQENVALKEAQCDVITFWSNLVTAANFPLLKRLAIHILTMFGSTYRCESAFSTMNIVKNQYRSRLTNEHTHQCVCLAVTPFKPRFQRLAKDTRGHFSH